MASHFYQFKMEQGQESIKALLIGEQIAQIDGLNYRTLEIGEIVVAGILALKGEVEVRNRQNAMRDEKEGADYERALAEYHKRAADPNVSRMTLIKPIPPKGYGGEAERIGLKAADQIDKVDDRPLSNERVFVNKTDH